MRIALTGHRPQRLGLPDDELDIKWARIGHWIFNQILDVSDVYCGMANGCLFHKLTPSCFLF